MQWNWLDAALLGIVVLSVVAAMWEGFIREVISLVSLVVGVLLAALEYQRAAEWLRDYTPSSEAAKGLGFLGLFLMTLLAGTLISILLRKVVQKAGFGFFDRFLGGVFGLVRGFVIASVLLLAMITFSIQTAVVQNSTFAPYVMTGARVIGAAMPQDLNSRFHKGLDQFRQALAEKDRKALGK